MASKIPVKSRVVDCDFGNFFMTKGHIRFFFLSDKKPLLGRICANPQPTENSTWSCKEFCDFFHEKFFATHAATPYYDVFRWLRVNICFLATDKKTTMDPEIFSGRSEFSKNFRVFIKFFKIIQNFIKKHVHFWFSGKGYCPFTPATA